MIIAAIVLGESSAIVLSRTIGLLLNAPIPMSHSIVAIDLNVLNVLIEAIEAIVLNEVIGLDILIEAIEAIVLNGAIVLNEAIGVLTGNPPMGKVAILVYAPPSPCRN